MMSATAYKRGDGIYLHSNSRTTMGLWIATPPFIRIHLDESEHVKGKAILETLAASGGTVEHPKQDEWNDVFCPMLRLAAVKSERAFEEGTLRCDLEVDGTQLRIVPCRQIRPGRGYESIESLAILISVQSSPGAISAGLEEAFSRCEIRRGRRER